MMGEARLPTWSPLTPLLTPLVPSDFPIRLLPCEVKVPFKSEPPAPPLPAMIVFPTWAEPPAVETPTPVATEGELLLMVQLEITIVPLSLKIP